MNNAEAIVQRLDEAGVRWAFGVPSGPVLPLIEALHRSPVRYVLTASETSAGFMATTAGALTGTPGVCIATLGPGATNLATGVGAALLDGAPVIAITCNVATPWLDRRVQMRIDHNALFAPLTKASFSLRDGDTVSTLDQALALACSEPPGPVHLDLPEDVALAGCREGLKPPAEHVTGLSSIGPAAFARVQAALEASRRPLLVCGLGLTRARTPQALLRFVETQELPFVLTMHAKGFLPEGHPWYAGVIGRARRSDVQRFVDRADLIVAAGYDEIEINYEEWAGDKPILHLSNRAAEPSGALRMLVNEAGDIDSAVEALNELPPAANDWRLGEVQEHRALLDRRLRPDGDFGTQHVLDALRGRLGTTDILAYDVGAHTHQVASQWRTDLPGTCISTNGWSSMGFGIPAAFAAKLVHPGRRVVGVVGDGCFQMTAGELATGRRLGLAVPIIVLNDGWLSLIKVKQEHREYALEGVELGTPVAPPQHYFGVPCRGVYDEGQLGKALDWAFSLDGPSVIEAFVDERLYSKTVYD